MHIENHHLLINNKSIPLPKLPIPAKVTVWAVPTEYRTTGYYVDTSTQHDIPSHPACSVYTKIGVLDLPAHPSAVLRAAKEDRIKHLNEVVEQMMDSFTSDYGFHTKLSWTDQKNEAYAYMNDPSTATPCLSSIAEGRGISLGVLVQKVIRKAEAYQRVSGLVMGECQRCEDLIDEISDDDGTVADVIAVDFNRNVIADFM